MQFEDLKICKFTVLNSLSTSALITNNSTTYKETLSTIIRLKPKSFHYFVIAILFNLALVLGFGFSVEGGKSNMCSFENLKNCKLTRMVEEIRLLPIIYTSKMGKMVIGKFTLSLTSSTFEEYHQREVGWLWYNV